MIDLIFIAGFLGSVLLAFMMVVVAMAMMR
jgi:hypothetical protein